MTDCNEKERERERERDRVGIIVFCKVAKQNVCIGLIH